MRYPMVHKLALTFLMRVIQQQQEYFFYNFLKTHRMDIHPFQNQLFLRLGSMLFNTKSNAVQILL